MLGADSPEKLETLHPSWIVLLASYAHLVHVIWKKIALVFLTLYGLHGLYRSLTLLFIKYPELEKLSAMQQISRTEIETVIAEVLVVLLATMVDTMLALRLSETKAIKSEVIDVILATAFLVFNNHLIRYLLSFDLIGIVARLASN